MNEVEKLIQKFCPDGVEFRELGEVLDYEQPTKYIVKTSKYSNEFETPVLTAGKSFILGHTDETEGIYSANKENPVIIFDDFTTSFHWVDFNFKVKSSAMKMIKLKKEANANFRFIFYAMKCLNYNPQDHSRHWISKYSSFKIPLPPLPIQNEIVKILDNFTELEAELEAELEDRKKQYEYCREDLLTFGDDVEFKELGEIVEIKHGKDYKHLSNGNYPLYGSGGIMKHVDKFSYGKPTVLIPRKGTITNIFYVDQPFWNVDTIYYTKINIEKILPKFLFYYMKTINLASMDTGSGRPSLTMQILNKIKIPIPPISEQERIVSILDKFDALVNDISIGLPAELKARRKQYEYYREKLLTFKPLEK